MAVVITLAFQTSVGAALITKDKVRSYEGVLQGNAIYTSNGEGHTSNAGDRAIDLTRQGGYVAVTDASFLNAATVNDEMTIALWIKKYDIAASSAFWIDSPSDNRVFQAHVPWNDNVIYFDTHGAANGVSRISANIDTFVDFTGDLTDISWWTNNWHFFVFSKKADVKQVWIDGKPFLNENNTAVLSSDIGRLAIGSGVGGGGPMHGLVDDFSIYSKALDEADITNLFRGTLPTALPAASGLMAYWDFNDWPSNGVFSTMVPTPDAMDADPNLIQVVHRDGVTPWTTNNVSLKVDTATVASTFAKVGDIVSVRYFPNPFFAAQSKHTVTLLYPDATGAQKTLEWQFTVGVYTKDRIQSRLGVFKRFAIYTDNAGGRTGQPGDYAADLSRQGGAVAVSDASFLNAASTNDEMSIALWIKKYDIVDSSAFWIDSPSQARVFQAHTPWSNNQIYFDTAGCCDGTQRINANIDTFADYTGDISWWNIWHLFVFSKKADLKEVWIDGKLFLQGNNTGVLESDIGRLMIGGDTDGGNLMHGLVDDFSIYSKALAEADITNLFSGTLPIALPANSGLLAYWDFNDVPPLGQFTTVFPTPDSTNAAPNLIKVGHLDGTSSVWDRTKVSLKVDNVVAPATVNKAGGVITVSYVPNPIFAVRSAHTATLLYDTALAAEWQFTVAGAYTKDVVRTNVGILQGAAVFTPDRGGKSGSAGDFGIDFGTANAGQAVYIFDATFLNQAATNDEMAVVSWQRLHQIANSALFWGVSDSTLAGSRGFFAATPWSDNVLYFDTAGCCDTATQRISANIDTFPDYSGDAGWWTNWHHLVVQKKLSTKEIWIDGKLFLTGDSSSPLPTDFTEAFLGLDPPDNARLRGVIDDFAVFGTALTEATITNLVAGTLPTALPASTKLLAYWNFNDATAVAPGPAVPTIGIAREGAVLKITYTGTLQSTATIGGQWDNVQGATSPFSVTPVAGPGGSFYRATQ